MSSVVSALEARQAVALPLDQWFELPAWEPAPPVPPATAAELGPCLILGGGPVAAALAARIRACGAEAVTAADGALGGAEPDVRMSARSAEEHIRVLRWMSERGQRPRRIIVAWTLESGARGPAGGDDGAVARALSPVVWLIQAIAGELDRSALQVAIVTAGAYDVDGTERVDPALTTMLGPTRVVPLELPHVMVRHVDLGRGGEPAGPQVAAALADRLVAELADTLGAPGPPVVALRGRVRWLPSLRSLDLSAQDGDRAWREGGCYLITGGLGAFGLAVAEHLAATRRARLALVSRTPLPARERWHELVDAPGTEPSVAGTIAALRRIEAAGGDPHVYAADVTSPEAMRGVRDDLLARFGRLDGIVHAAGIAAGGLVENRDWADIERVLAPKVRGTVVLSEVFGEQPVDFLVLCSSLTSFVGGVGHLDYCAANAFLDGFPRSDLPLADRALAVNWGGLLGSGMWIPREGDVGMELPDAARALGRALGGRVGPRVSIAPVRVQDARPWLPDAGPSTGVTVAPAAGEADLEQRLAQLWAEVLELDEVPLDGHFFELGGNSLLGVELLWRLADDLGFRLPMQLLTDAGTPASIARAIEARLHGDADAS